MTILINDEQKEVPDGATVSDVVFSVLQLETSGMAIAINDSIVHRQHWETRQLLADDKMLVIKASKGG